MLKKLWNLEEYAKKAREAVAEGIVLLRNENKALPLKNSEKISVFGRSQFNYYKSGTGSGGLVNVDYVVGIYEALEQSKRYDLNMMVRRKYDEWIMEHPYNEGQGWASEPWYQEEMPLEKEFVEEAARESDTAIILIGRTAGEDKDNKNEPGSYLLTEIESDMIFKICNTFSKTIVLLNVGNIIDMSWVDKYKPDAVAYVWQGGQEGGNGVLDIISGDVSPSGCLSDTIATSIYDYPSTECFGDEKENIHTEDIYVGYRYFETFAKEKVLYPFGFGLSYSSFGTNVISFDVTDTDVKIGIQVTNSGSVSGKHVVQVYACAPQGLLGKPSKVLCGFAKTNIIDVGNSQTVNISIPLYYMSSYDDSGVTGYKSCYVLEEGDYNIYVGNDVRSAKCVGTFNKKNTIVLDRCNEALAPVKSFPRIKPGKIEVDEIHELTYEDTHIQTILPSKKRSEMLPEDIEYTGDLGYKLIDVTKGKISMSQFIAQLSEHDLCTLIRGEGMSSHKVTPGIAGAFGGVTEKLLSFGIPIAGCADGPSGIRMDSGIKAFAMPNGTCLACTFNEGLLEELYEWEGIELRKNRIDTLLGPGINIHRNPLNGRNFEYFSEDPLLTGKMAVAQLKGMDKYKITGTIKHFACNTQEYKRTHVDAVVSERAVREIYLKGFEIAVKEGNARSIMSTYGPLNGIWTASNYDLLTEVLRKEWGFNGIVMSDWWSLGNDEVGSLANIKNVSAKVRAQNDLNMVNTCSEKNSGKDNLMDALLDGTLTRGELQRSAINICNFLITTPAYLHMQGEESPLDLELKAACSQEDIELHNMEVIHVCDIESVLDVSKISTKKGSTTTMSVVLEKRGIYNLELTLRAMEVGELAQLPITVYKDKEIVSTVTLSGSQTEWTTEKIKLPPCYTNNFYLRAYFAQTGLEIKEAKLVLVTDLEEQIELFIKKHSVDK